MYFYQAAKAPDKATCEFYLEKIKVLNPAAGKSIAEAPREKWAMYATRGNVVWDDVTSNASESTNSAMGAEVSRSCSSGLFCVAWTYMVGLPAPIPPCFAVFCQICQRYFFSCKP